MNLSNQNILFFSRNMGIGGTENVIIQLCEIFNHRVNKIIVCSNGGISEKKLTELGIEHYKIPDLQNKNPINVIKIFCKILRIIREEKITIVHTHHRMATFYAMLASKMLKFKFVSSSHNIFKDKKEFTKLIYNNSNVIAVGHKVKENLCDFYNVREKNITVINNAIKPFNDKIVYLKELKKYKDDGYFLIGNIGRLSEQKGIEYYIKSIPYIIESNNKVIFFIIGDGEDKAKLEQLVEELGMSKNIIFLGYRQDIQNIISQLDLLIMSSLWEGFPLVPIESFSVGKTVVATDIDGTNEIIKNNYNGILVEPRNENKLAAAIIELINNKDKIKYLNKNALETYQKKFSYDIFKSNYISYYESLGEN